MSNSKQAQSENAKSKYAAWIMKQQGVSESQSQTLWEKLPQEIKKGWGGN
jgi:hypothetical protein